MKKYFRVWKQSLKNSLSYLFAYRSDFILKLFLGFGWSFTWIAMIEIFFSHTESFHGWKKIEVLLIVFSFQFLESVHIFANNLTALESDIRRGNFDFTVTKPIDSQFLSTFLRPDLSNLIFFLSYEIPLVVLFLKNKIDIIWFNIPAYIILLICASSIWLSITTLCASINFWKQRMDNVQWMAWSVMEFGRYPMTLFPKSLKFLFFSFVPVAFVGFVPASVLLGRSSKEIVLLTLPVTLFFLFLSRVVWKKAVKKYSSASS